MKYTCGNEKGHYEDVPHHQRLEAGVIYNKIFSREVDSCLVPGKKHYLVWCNSKFLDCTNEYLVSFPTDPPNKFMMDKKGIIHSIALNNT